MQGRGVRWGSLHRLGAAALVPVSLALLVLRCATDPDVPFLRHDPDAPWRMAPTEVSALLEQWGKAEPQLTTYRARSVLRELPGAAALEVRALRSFRLRVNGQAVEAVPPADWRDPLRVDLRPHLRRGTNEFEIEVTNRRGPGLLAVGFEGLGEAAPRVWDTEVDGAPQGAAIPADDTRRNPNALTVETPWEGLLASRNALLALFVVGALGLALVPRLPATWLPSLPGAALALASLAWVWLFLAKTMRIAPLIGFDARAHLAYVDHLRAEGALPLATDGWSMYHPPLFYVLSAWLHAFGDRALKVLPFVSALGLVFVAHSLATRLYRDRPGVALLTVAFAASFPMALYSGAYVTNEPLHALLAGVALVATVDALLAERSTLRGAVAVGLWLGLAALTKFTVLAIAPVALFFLAVKWLGVERLAPSRTAGRLAAALGAFALVAGWFYARNVWHFGTPVVGNWALPGEDQVWWQQPGFHTWAYYLSFGESLRHPYLAGFAGFWDGVYSTLWGDGYIAGRVYPHERHTFWSYDLMSAGYLLALPVTALAVFGGGLALRDALRDPDPGRRAALSFLLTACYAIAFAFLFLTVSLPFFAQAKSPYALSLSPVLAVFFAAGTARVDAWLAATPSRRPLRLAFAGLLTTALGCFFLGFAA
ncbi:MAG: hypothetical protein ACQGVC_05115 [Myxococcota bacterium]